MTTVVHSHQLDSPSRDLIPRQVGKDVGDWLLAGCMSDMSNTTAHVQKEFLYLYVAQLLYETEILFTTLD